MKQFTWILFLFIVGKTLAQQDDSLHFVINPVNEMELQQQKIEWLKKELERAKKAGVENQENIDRLRKENEALKEIMKSYHEQIDQLERPEKELLSDTFPDEIPPMAISVADKDTGVFKYVSNKDFLNEIDLKTAEAIQMMNDFWKESDRTKRNKNGE